MKFNIKKRLLNGEDVTMSIPSTTHSRLAWLAISPLLTSELSSFWSFQKEIDFPIDSSVDEYVYRVLTFEIEKDTIENNYDISHDEMFNEVAKILPSFDSLISELEKRNIDTMLLKEPWNTDIPI